MRVLSPDSASAALVERIGVRCVGPRIALCDELRRQREDLSVEVWRVLREVDQSLEVSVSDVGSVRVPEEFRYDLIRVRWVARIRRAGVVEIRRVVVPDHRPHRSTSEGYRGSRQTHASGGARKARAMARRRGDERLECHADDGPNIHRARWNLGVACACRRARRPCCWGAGVAVEDL